MQLAVYVTQLGSITGIIVQADSTLQHFFCYVAELASSVVHTATTLPRGISVPYKEVEGTILRIGMRQDFYSM